jgi:hypothetical protein
VPPLHLPQQLLCQAPTKGTAQLRTRGLAPAATAEVECEDGIDLQALLAGAVDFQEAGDGTSRHSLDMPAFDFEVQSADSIAGLIAPACCWACVHHASRSLHSGGQQDCIQGEHGAG